ncbi:unnamed protein product [Sphagnum jensenii]|uniref:Uncharacterized protein n=1 Tax=Sphagnum jensenii TaxID=128206 RepID=A0ABP0WEB6_9BRYO
MSREATSLVKEISGAAKSFQSIADLADVMNKVKQAKVVMLGEASHAWHASVLPLASFHLTGVGGKTRIQFHRCGGRFAAIAACESLHQLGGGRDLRS